MYTGMIYIYDRCKFDKNRKIKCKVIIENVVDVEYLQQEKTLYEPRGEWLVIEKKPDKFQFVKFSNSNSDLTLIPSIRLKEEFYEKRMESFKECHVR